eukprot:superscaffoldBa00000152_g2180
MSAKEAPNPGMEQADGGSAATDGPSPTLASTTKSTSPPPVTVKKEPGTSETSNGKVGDPNPAEICVVIGGNDGGASRGGSRRAQTEGMFALGTPPPTKSTDSCIESETMVGDGLPQTPNRFDCI